MCRIRQVSTGCRMRVLLGPIPPAILLAEVWPLAVQAMLVEDELQNLALIRCQRYDVDAHRYTFEPRGILAYVVHSYCW